MLSMQSGKRKDVLLATAPMVHSRGEGVRRFAREAGWSLIDISRLVGGTAGLGGWRGDGALVTLGQDRKMLAFVGRLRRAGIPVVDLSNQCPDIDVPRVCLDNRAIGRLAAAHFAERNYRHAAWFSTNWTNVQAERFAGFSEAWAAEACPPHGGHFVEMPLPGSSSVGTLPRSVRNGPVRQPLLRWVLRESVPAARQNDQRTVARWFAELLGNAPKPLALLCHAGEDAARILSECRVLGIAVPEDIAILSAGDYVELCETQAVPISSVEINGERHGYEAAALLQRLMDGEPPPRGPTLVPPGPLTVRASTDWTSATDPLVARALMLVAKNLSHPWGVAQLARELGVPPLRLGRHFTAELGHSPGEEILRQRLAKARTLLRETDLPLAKIAELCGFCHASYFSNVFRRETGLSPRKWRKGRG